MPGISIADCDALLRSLEQVPIEGADAQHAAARLREHLEQTQANAGVFELANEPGVEPSSPDETIESCTLHVCTSCRPTGTPREPRENRPGFKLYEALRARLNQSPMRDRIDVKPAECLSLCPRPCGIAISSPGAWSYLFGEQNPEDSAEEILECLSLYLGTKDGLMPREQRPKSLRSSVLGRVPPFGKSQ